MHLPCLQVFGLQTKCEKLVEQQVEEIKKLDELRKEAVKAREAAMAEAHQLRERLADATASHAALQQQLESRTGHDESCSTPVPLHQESQGAPTPSAEHVTGDGDMPGAPGTAGIMQEEPLQLMKQRVEEAEQQLLMMKVSAEQAAQQHAQALEKVTPYLCIRQ